MPFSILVPNTCFPTKTNCFSVLGISWYIRVLVFFNIVIHAIIDTRFGYFIFVDRNRLISITDINRNKSLVADFAIAVLLRLVLTVFQVLSMLLLDSLFSLKSNFDVNISLRISFSFFRSSIWFCNDLIFLNYVP